MEKVGKRRPLDGLAIGISISEPEDLADYGFLPEDVTSVTVELSQRLIALGACVVLGHQWRPGGIMEALARFALAYQEKDRGPIIRNVMAWPDQPAIGADELKRLEGLLEIAVVAKDERSRPKAFRLMRERLTQMCDARICIGGKLEQPSGFVHGVVEEAALMRRTGKPVFISPMMGGAACVMADYARGAGNALSKLKGGNLEASQAWLESIPARIGRFGPVLTVALESHNLDSLVEICCKSLSRSGE